jgi:S-formylglutathione hydrolase FrmB
MRSLLGLAILVGVAAEVEAAGILWRSRHKVPELATVNCKLNGTVLDFTHNHGCDRRIYSPALDSKRDLYIYLPPGFDHSKRYPVIFYLHGLGQDETRSLNGIEIFDKEISAGRLPPTILVVPDGSIRGHPSLLNAGSFFLNSRAGRFEDYLMRDIWNFVHESFPIIPDRCAHVFVGLSMGGNSAYNLAFKYRDRIGVVAGILPPLNPRFGDCKGRYSGKFDPNCFTFRDRIRPLAPVAFYKGLYIPQAQLIGPLYGVGREAREALERENPAEMLETHDVRPGQYAMYIAYGDADEFNIHNQVLSFLHLASHRNLEIRVVCVPGGKHSHETVSKVTPDLMAWLSQQLCRFRPDCDKP